jgi:putative flavoprotein involved in K+ transport
MATLDTVVVGGGQAGLAIAHHLQRAGRRFVVVEAADRLGDAWRRRWDSLTLFTPRRYDALPGLTFPGDPEGCPGKDEVADYLEDYARHFQLPVRLSSPVRSVRPDGDGFVVETGGDALEARQVVVATGGFAGPFVPACAPRLDAGVAQLHSSAYRNPGSVAGQDVVVVGAGNTGVQIADELARAGRRVTLAAGTVGRALPLRLLGRSLFWWSEALGTMSAGPDTRLGRRLRQNENAIVGTDLRDLFRRVERAGRVLDADSDGLVLATPTPHDHGIQRDHEIRRPDAVVWATGYRASYPWLHVPVLDAAGAPVHTEGLTAVPGLAFLGLPWQRNRGSALLGWVGRDAAVLGRHLDRHVETQQWPHGTVEPLATAA